MKYKPVEEKLETEPLKKGNFLRESDVRIIIDRKLKEADWNIEDKSQVSTEEPVKEGRADYLLKDRRGRPLAVIEAKRFSIDPEAGKQQALEYTKEFQADFIFLSNGQDIYFWDYNFRPEQKVITFFSQRDLEKLLVLRKSKKPLSVISIPDNVFVQGETNKEKIDVSIFNQSLFNQFGGLPAILRIFGEKEIQNNLQELNNEVFV